MAQATTGGGTSDWPSQIGSSDRSLLVQGQLGDALHAVLCATGYNLRWLLRAMLRLGLTAAFLRPVLRVLVTLLNGNHSPFSSNRQDSRLIGVLE